MTNETPEERLRQIMDRKRRGGAPQENKPEGRDVLRGMLEELLDKLRGAGRGDVHIAEVTFNDGEMEVKELDASAAPSGQPPTLGGDSGLPMDTTMLGLIDDETTRTQAQQFLQQVSETSIWVSSTDPHGPLTRFILAVGSILSKAAFAGGMMHAAHQGKAGITPEDLSMSMGATVGVAVLAAVRYGQNNPDALTATAGVDAKQFEEGLAEFLSGLEEVQPDDTKEEDN